MRLYSEFRAHPFIYVWEDMVVAYVFMMVCCFGFVCVSLKAVTS